MESKYRISQIVENEARWSDQESRINNLINIKESLEEIQKKHPFIKSKGGIPLSYENETIYVDASDSHSLIIGSTGSKKTRLIVMPSVKLLSLAEESMIITDPKGEVYNRTAYDLRDMDYEIIVINFRNPSTGDCWNPLHIPFTFFKRGEIDRAREYANDVATNLALTNISSKDPYWDESAYNLLYGLILLAFIICKENETVSMKDVLQLREAVFPSKSTVAQEYISIARQDSIVYRAISGTITAPDNTRACILSEFDQKVSCFSYQKDLSDMMDHNSVDIGNLANQKSAVFLIMPDEKTIYHKLISLFVKQSYEYLIYQAQYTSGLSTKCRINYILDEFSTLPCINDFPAMISAARSRNIRFNLIIQSIQQLYSKYGDDSNIIRGNCNNLLYLYSRELDTLDEISALCGKKDDKYLVTTFALQHLNKDKGECLVLSGRLFPYITCLKDISFFDDEKYQMITLTKRNGFATKRKSVVDYTNKIKQLKKVVNTAYRGDEKQENSKILDDEMLSTKNNTNYYKLLIMLGVCFLSFISFYKTSLPTPLLTGVIIVCGILLIVAYGTSIYDMLDISIEKIVIVLLIVPMIIIEVIKWLVFPHSTYSVVLFLCILCFWYSIVIAPYLNYKASNLEMSRFYGFFVFIISILTGGMVIGCGIVDSSWYADINAILVLGFVIINIAYHITLSYKNRKYVDYETLVTIIDVFSYGIYMCLSATAILIQCLHLLYKIVK